MEWEKVDLRFYIFIAFRFFRYMYFAKYRIYYVE